MPVSEITDDGIVARADMYRRKQVTENLLLFLEGAAIDLEGRMDAVTDVLATLIDGDAGRYDRCLDRLWERLQPRRDTSDS
jgi:hypothetical protein